MSAATVADTRSLRHWLRGADGPHLVICCVEHPDPDAWSRAVVAVGAAHTVVQLSTCVAKTPPAALLELIAAGAGGITVALDGCANPAAAELVVAHAGAFLSALHHPQTIGGVTAWPQKRKHGPAWPILDANVVPVSRRALLGRIDGPDLVEPSKHPTRRLAAVLRELADGDGSRTELDTIPTGIPQLSAARCAGSGACARICPVGALTLTNTVLAEASPGRDAMAQFQLIFDPERCTDCGKCLPVCPESALGRSGEYRWSSLLAQEPASLRVGLIRPCAHCGVPHGRAGVLCVVCAYRAANPFGSRMPPGWLPEAPAETG